MCIYLYIGDNVVRSTSKFAILFSFFFLFGKKKGGILRRDLPKRNQKKKTKEKKNNSYLSVSSLVTSLSF